MDCSLSGSSIHGIFQAKVLEWIAISFSRGSSWPRNRTRVSHIAARRFTVWATREAIYAKWVEGKRDEDSWRTTELYVSADWPLDVGLMNPTWNFLSSKWVKIKQLLNQNKFIGSCNWKVRDWSHCQTLDTVIQCLSLSLSVHYFSIWANPNISFHRLNSSRHQVQGKVWRSDTAAISGLNQP